MKCATRNYVSRTSRRISHFARPELDSSILVSDDFFLLLFCAQPLENNDFVARFIAINCVVFRGNFDPMQIDPRSCSGEESELQERPQRIASHRTTKFQLHFVLCPLSAAGRDGDGEYEYEQVPLHDGDSGDVRRF